MLAVIAESTGGGIGLKKVRVLVGIGAEFGGKTIVIYLFIVQSGVSGVGLK